MGPSFPSLGSIQREKGWQGAAFLASPGQGSTKHLYPRAVKGQSPHCTEKKDRHRASNAPGEGREELFQTMLPSPGSCWLRSVCVQMRHCQVWRGGRKTRELDDKINAETG